MFVDTSGYVLCGGWWIVGLMIDVLQCGDRLHKGLIGAFVQVKSDVLKRCGIFPFNVLFLVALCSR